MTDFAMKAAHAGLSEADLDKLRAAVGFDDSRLQDALYAIATEPSPVHAMAKATKMFGVNGPRAVQLATSTSTEE